MSRLEALVWAVCPESSWLVTGWHVSPIQSHFTISQPRFTAQTEKPESHLRKHFNDKMPSSQSHDAHLCTK